MSLQRFSVRCRWNYFGALLIAIVAVYGCGSGGAGSGDGDEGSGVSETTVNAIGDRVEISAWTRPNAEFSYEDFIDAGWKQRQVYDVGTLPSALEARYGFFNRRDVEIRRYATHEDAIGVGAESAEEAIDRTVHDGSGFASRRVYGGYLVAGNLVMMCEVSTDDCLGLIEAVEASQTE